VIDESLYPEDILMRLMTLKILEFQRKSVENIRRIIVCMAEV
jgi:hypothetical protein